MTFPEILDLNRFVDAKAAENSAVAEVSMKDHTVEETKVCPTDSADEGIKK